MYANYCLHKLNMLPSTFVGLSDNEKAFVIASIQLRIEAEKRNEKRKKS